MDERTDGRKTIQFNYIPNALIKNSTDCSEAASIEQWEDAE